MRFIAKQLAQALFQLILLSRFVKQHAGLLALVAVMQLGSVALALALVGLRQTAKAVFLDNFITADGTTASKWNLSGESGPTWTNSGGDSAISAVSSMSLESASTVNVGVNASEPTINIGDQSGSATGTLNIGSATGGTVINLQTQGLFGGLFVNTPNFILNSSGPFGDQITLNANLGNPASLSAGGFSGSTTPTAFESTVGTTLVDAPTVEIGPTAATETVVGNNSATNLLNGANVQVQASGVTTFTVGTNGFMPVNSGTLVCGTGGTKTVPVNSFGLVVTTGTLSSNCVIDFSTNGSTGLYFVDLSGATAGATFGIQFKNGSAAKTYLSTGVISGTLATVWTHGTDTLAVNY
ncbi:MAG TPA: hypothetical protein VJY33_19460 [Isosphaeraceae bacterium]|nr:hypothetical protein [Isosphaeraceae bacterium]